MKKTSYIYHSMLFGSLILGSCSSSFLDVEPMTSVLESNFYKTIADADMALVGCYDGYQRTTSNGSQSFYLTAEVSADNCFGGTGTTDGRSFQAIDRFDIAQSQSDNNIFDGTWSDYYAGIFRCNTLLGKLDGTDFSGNTTARARIEGETKFLRATMYFDLVRLFENIPLLTSPTNENIPQSDPKAIYQLIVSDLKFAAANIPATAYPKSAAATNDGRATPFAAKALLARVYLFYSGYYGGEDIGVSKAEALAGLEEVIGSGQFALVADFKNLWPAASYIPNASNNTLDISKYAGKGNAEVVFAQKFNNTSNYNGYVDGNRWVVFLGLRGKNWSPYGQGWGACTVSKKFFNEFDNTDTRKTASIIDIDGENITGFDLKDQREYTGYTIKKYAPTALPDGTTNTGGDKDMQLSQDQDYFVIRYADVLLMAAELGSANAQKYFDEVRKRAYKTNFVSLAVSKNNILKERKFEFAFEGIRYWDVLRQGLNNAAATLETTEDVLSGSVPEKVIVTKERFLTTKGFMQIPNKQITLSNGVLKQNAGWN
ncbi:MULTISPECIES: RagB/SusD family nutrient uptake outer membrane protein [Sphingobacterium]|jgi:starch-binding outer membrane protein, SusD/RagB family|uniref:Carbohydrate-binding protein SusD n=5 Tax=Sphingobacterium multivorum TaxID=28454 RepID=A0A654DDH5_SPHMU|nr:MULTISPECIES: RagB/SusD family nutrient uptake outer membrane protein [Sphingobacterium]OFV11081.1 carbohydrate-binding protein SusD [Sphingobacterium sp. HMSC13C05]QQT45256.1 RagB/SusD family nutrient uptake outer membrane protein [Sphingobacterium multivorum]QQT62107.1 RagB/SusD family nutrient uptake outer membrane protein [Sphingobacterium multivorum]SUJ22390.1 SusD family [Sphingobacterium multivorum]VXD03371.1 Carbohydrate-binding protein SusD [Sphingobacterium multivorum]